MVIVDTMPESNFRKEHIPGAKTSSSPCRRWPPGTPRKPPARPKPTTPPCSAKTRNSRSSCIAASSNARAAAACGARVGGKTRLQERLPCYGRVVCVEGGKSAVGRGEVGNCGNRTRCPTSAKIARRTIAYGMSFPCRLGYCWLTVVFGYLTYDALSLVAPSLPHSEVAKGIGQDLSGMS